MSSKGGRLVSRCFRCSGSRVAVRRPSDSFSVTALNSRGGRRARSVRGTLSAGEVFGEILLVCLLIVWHPALREYLDARITSRSTGRPVLRHDSDARPRALSGAASWHLVTPDPGHDRPAHSRDHGRHPSLRNRGTRRGLGVVPAAVVILGGSQLMLGTRS